MSNAEELNNIIWKNDKEIKIEALKWKILKKEENSPKILNFSEKDFKSPFHKVYKQNIYEINPVIPVNNYIEKNNFRTKVEWKSSFGGGNAGGTGQQNNSFRVDYGLGDFTQLTGYFAEADDDTFNPINGKRAQ